MKPVVLGLTALSLLPGVALASALVDARSGAMGGVGIASGNFTSADLNPALLTRATEQQRFAMRLGVGAVIRDVDNTIDDVDQIQDTLDAFEAVIDRQDPNDLPEAQRLAELAINQLEALDQANPTGSAEPALGFYVPSQSLGFSLTLGAQARVDGRFHFDESDRTVLEQALQTGQFDQEDILSYADANAVVVSELKLGFARLFNARGIGEFALGIAPKWQRLDSYFYRATVAEFDKDELTSDDNMTDSTQFNLDLGLHKGYGPWQFGLVAQNLMGHSLRNVEQQTLKLKPSYTGAVAYQHNGFTAALDLDLAEDRSFEAFMLPSQWAKVGLEYDFGGHFQLRGGYRSDLASNHGDRATVGLGISPGRLVSLDLAGEFGDDDEYGVRLQLGLNF
ncbi:conjugal transfer protein TraF [Ferrimonas pelagia]|uniref:Conjugal transfer protein TraF n=1 Tax=Ferrimonas pelagia TaxID=1177826 RepID=A0ABP9F5B4_9GAMM